MSLCPINSTPGSLGLTGRASMTFAWRRSRGYLYPKIALQGKPQRVASVDSVSSNKSTNLAPVSSLS